MLNSHKSRSFMAGKLTGKIALVIGANSGIGLATDQRFVAVWHRFETT
jgi:hypothetical protein